MLLSKLLKGVETSSVYEEAEITSVVNDSRKAGKGALFVCLQGEKTDGHLYAAKALEMGAEAVLCQRDLGLSRQILVADSHKAYAQAAANFFGNPDRELTLLGITGTKGKTTTTKLIKSILEQAGKKVGLIGSIQNEIGAETFHAENTTPDAMELYELYRKMADAGCSHCVMEVSSHALVQQRIGESHYKVAAFTNLSQDHLDYHKDMEDYFSAKERLFSICDSAVVNLDDPYGRRLAEKLEVPCITFSIQPESSAVLKAQNIVYHAESVEFEILYKGIVSRVHFGMPGVFSVKNALTAVGVCLQLGICLKTAIEGITRVNGVRGRCEIVPTGRNFTVICDHAHSPGSLENVLSAMKATCKGRLVALFGCGGDRDKTKRPLMAKAAAENADFVIITSDNPRTEQPGAIIQDILPGMEGYHTPYVVVENRREAIFYAVQNAQPGDTIVLAGKGHEDYQIIGTQKYHFDEREIVAEALKTLEN